MYHRRSVVAAVAGVVMAVLSLSGCTRSAQSSATLNPLTATNPAASIAGTATADPPPSPQVPVPTSASGPGIVAPRPIALPAKTPPSAEPLVLYSRVMSDLTLGWGTFTSGNRGAIAVTRDGGTHWTRVTVPPRCHSESLPYRVTGRSAYVIGSTSRDDLGSRSSVTLCRTIDLGRTWSVISNFDIHGWPSPPQFLDARHGWLVGATGGGMHSAGNTYVYRTTDAGLSWHEVAARVVTTLPGFGTSFGNLPEGCGLGFSFVTALTAWATAGCGNGSGGTGDVVARYVAVTTDGGYSWHAVTLPRPTFAAGRTGCLVGAACGVGALITTVSRVVLFAGGVDAVGALYVSADGGHTWAVRALPERHVWITLGGNTFFASSQDSGSQWSSTDDGRTWRRRSATALISDPGSTQYETARIGFRTAYTGHGAERFQRTLDAGRHWETLHPLLDGH